MRTGPGGVAERLFYTVLLALFALPVMAGEPVEKPAISLIIDDLGDNWPMAKRAIELHGALTYSILPKTPYAQRIANRVYERGGEVMLHQPMESVGGSKLGPGGLTLHMTRDEFVATLHENLASLPHVKGINNHMGSLLTRHPGHMAWLMDELAAEGSFYFVDSRTSLKTVAYQLAAERGLEWAKRDVFLDHEIDPEHIRRQFAHGLERARQHGYAVLIGHPYPETLDVLEERLPQLEAEGIRLITVSRLIEQRKERSTRLWQASLSPSQKAAKSLKQ